MTQNQARVVVGVVPGQAPEVVATAATYAEQFDAELVCAFVDSTRYPVDTTPLGVVAMSVDPDVEGRVIETFDPAWRDALAAVLDERQITWSVRALAGGPAQELARLADELDATMIVVGTRAPGIRGSLHEFFSGSVAVHLAHQQHRPIVVVPLSPVAEEDELPWRAEPRE